MARKTVKFNRTEVAKLPDDKPAVYKILTAGGRNNYTGSAKRGRVRDRIMEHLPDGKDPIPGAKVEIEQMPTVEAAREKEGRIIARSKPLYNTRGK